MIKLDKKQVNMYNEARKARILASLKEKDADIICTWSDSIFFESFETPAENIEKIAKAFHEDIVPF